MNIYFTQIYIRPGVNFPFSHLFQHLLSNELTNLAAPSPKFIKDYGRDFNLTFYISAKKVIRDNEVKGPSVFRKTKDVEYTIFLPFDVISRNTDVLQNALRFLLKGVVSAFDLLEIETASILQQQADLIARICSDPTMVKKSGQRAG